MIQRTVVCLLGGALLLGAAVPSVAAPAGQPASGELATGLADEIDQLEREFRRLQSGGDEGDRQRAEEALAELRRMRRDLDRWLARSERQPYRRSLDRFLGNLERRLARLGDGLGPPTDRPPGRSPGERRKPPPRRVVPAAPAAGVGAPPNDACGAAQWIGDGSFSGDTTAATTDGEASCGASLPGPDIWFRYVAPASGDVMFNTFGSSFDTVLSLHSECPGTVANELECNDDEVGVQSELTRELAMGDEVLVRIGGFAGDYGAFVLNTGRPAGIVGSVTDAGTGFGVGGVEIEVFEDPGYWRGRTYTSPSGAYSLEGLRQGVHYVKASDPAYLAELFDDIDCPDYCDATTGTAIPTELGGVARADFALGRAGAIEGWVTDEDGGAPLPEVRVRIYDSDGYWKGSGETAADGAYSVVGLDAGDYYARAEPFSVYLAELFDEIACPFEQCEPSSGTVIPVVLGVPARADFTLQRGGSISGRITDSVSGQPIRWARVHLTHQDGASAGTGDTDDTGRYEVSGLLTGTYFAVGSESNYSDQLYDGLACPPAGCSPLTGTPIPVVAGSESGGIDFALLRDGAFTGVVVDEAFGVSLDDIVVDAWDDQGIWVENGYTDAGGVYTLTGLPAGSYFATTHNDSGYLDELYDDLPCVDGSCAPLSGSPIAVATAMTTTDIDFALELGGRVSGRVFDVADDQGLQRPVRLWDSGGDQVRYLYPSYSSQGSYALLGLATGTYFATVDGWSDYHSELYDDLPCTGGCDPTSGTPIPVTTGSETGGVDFGLCGQPALVAHFPPSGDPNSFIDGCRVQVGGGASAYAPGCPPVDHVHWEWGDGKNSDADFPAVHMYEPGHERVTVTATAWDALGIGSDDVRKELWLWDCLAPGVCGYPEDRQLFNLLFDSAELIQACSTIELGPGLGFVAPADVTIRAGLSVKLGSGVRVAGGEVAIVIDPGLLP